MDWRRESVTVLVLADGTYVEHGTFCRGERANSLRLPGLTVEVAAVFDAQ